MKSPALSIVIPVWNRAHIVGKIISRVLGQNFRDFELILVNDGSTDKTLGVLQDFAKKDSRIKIINQKNGGPSAARNAGLAKARGEYLMLLDSDDDIDPSMIQKMFDKISREKADLITCGIEYITFKNGEEFSQVDIGISELPPREKNETFATYIVKLLGIDGRLYNPCNKIFRTKIIRENNLRYKIGLNFGEDLTFNLHYLKFAKKIDFLLEPLYIYNFDTSSGEFGKSSLIYENRQKNYRELLKFAGENRDEKMNDFLGWIKYYWFYSFALAVCASQKTFREKLKLLKSAAKSEKFVRAKSSQFIGRKKYLVEKTLDILSRSAPSLYFFMKISSLAKNNRLFAKVWRKLAVSLTPQK